MDLGFIGLGHMGGPMARRLIQAGHRVYLHDLETSRVEALVAEGAVACESPAAVVARAPWVCLSLPKPAVVEAVVHQGAAALLTGEGLRGVIDFSTTGPKLAKALGEDLAARGVTMIDCPISGGPSKAGTGELALLAAGAPTALEELRPVLERLGRLFVVGTEPGMAQTMKVINNMMSLSALAIASEGLALGVKAGLDADGMIEALNASSGMNTATLDKMPRHVLTGRFDFGMALALSCKDIRLCLDEAVDHGVPMIVGGSVAQLLTATKARYGETADMTCMARLMEEWAGCEIRGSRARA